MTWGSSMWWNMLVARFLKVFAKMIVKIFIVTTSLANWSICNRQPRWRLKNSYPTMWMILSAVMLNNHFVQIIAGSYLHQTLISSFKNSVTADPRILIPPPPNKTPDPLTRTCKIKFSHHKKLNKGSNNNVYTMNNTNVTYSTFNAQ